MRRATSSWASRTTSTTRDMVKGLVYGGMRDKIDVQNR